MGAKSSPYKWFVSRPKVFFEYTVKFWARSALTHQHTRAHEHTQIYSNIFTLTKYCCCCLQKLCVCVCVNWLKSSCINSTNTHTIVFPPPLSLASLLYIFLKRQAAKNSLSLVIVMRRAKNHLP